MKAEIYLDIIFILNFIMDSFVFWCVSKVQKRKVLFYKILLGGLLSAISYVLVVMFIPFNIAVGFILNLIIMLLSVYVIFKPRKLKEGIKLVLISFIFSFLIGGFATSLIYSFKDSLVVLTISTIIFYFLLKYISPCFKSFYKKQVFYELEIVHQGKKISLKALCDTGHSLREPISQKSVIIVNKEKTKGLNIEENLRLIPFKSLGKERGILMGMVADRVIIYDERKIIIDKAIIGIYENELSENNMYNALISPEILTEV